MKLANTLSAAKRAYGIMLNDKVQFMSYYWRDEITQPLTIRQRITHNSTAVKRLILTGRKTTKTDGIEAEVIMDGVKKYDTINEMMLVTPGDKQMALLRDRILGRINREPMFRMLMSTFNRNDGTLKWAGNCYYYFRIEGTDGTDRNMIGLRARKIIGDEMQLGNQACHNSRLQSAMPGAKTMYCGVPDGRHDSVFYRLDQTPMGVDYEKYHMSSYVNPLFWVPGVREQKWRDYGGRESPDYVTQVLGKHGRTSRSAFPVDALALHDMPYSASQVVTSNVPKEIGDALVRMRLAGRIKIPLSDAKLFAIGMDFGSKQDPTEIGIFALVNSQSIAGNLQTDWHLVARIEGVGLSTVHQSYLMQYLVEIIGFDKVAIICIDLSSGGQGVGDELRAITPNPGWWQRHLIDLASGGTIERNKDILVENVEDVNADLRFKVKRKVFFTMRLQTALIAARNGIPSTVRLWLPKSDEAIIQELSATRERKTPNGSIEYEPPNNGVRMPIDHNTDMLRAGMAAMIESTKFIGENEERLPERYVTDEPLFGRKTLSRMPDFGRTYD